MKPRNVIWHEHFESKRCIDNLHGRYDACEDSQGFLVWDVGKNRIFRVRSQRAAIVLARQLANLPEHPTTRWIRKPYICTGYRG
jgi:hypothetical protein